MHIRVVGDSSWETGLSMAMNVISESSLKSHFESRDYGPGLSRIGIILMCRDPTLVFKRRIKFSKKEGALYMDIMLDYNDMVNSSLEKRCEIVKAAVLTEISEVIKTYKIVGFDKEKFLSDFVTWAADSDWI